MNALSIVLVAAGRGPAPRTSWCSRCSCGPRRPGARVFGTDPQFAEQSKALAANQGLYNGFLVAGLVWGLVADDTDVLLFFTGCVVVAGVYGAATVNRRILFVQALPGLLAFLAVLAAR